jgi:hypothetical protein
MKTTVLYLTWLQDLLGSVSDMASYLKWSVPQTRFIDHFLGNENKQCISYSNGVHCAVPACRSPNMRYAYKISLQSIRDTFSNKETSSENILIPVLYMLGIVHCLRCFCYTRRFGSWLYSGFQVTGCHYIDRFCMMFYIKINGCYNII